MKLANSQGRWKLDNPIVWTPELVRRLEASEDKIARVVDHWLDRIIGGFITDFVVDTLVSYSEVERCFLKGQRCFLKGQRGEYVKYLNTWIKILSCEKRVMQLP